MNSTDFSGELKKEKGKLYEVSCKYNGENILKRSVKEDNDSYFKKYNESKHIGSALTSYDSMEMEDFRVLLDDLWADGEMEMCKPVILAAYRKSLKSNVNMVHTVDLYNYAM